MELNPSDIILLYAIYLHTIAQHVHYQSNTVHINNDDKWLWTHCNAFLKMTIKIDVEVLVSIK